MAATSQSFQIVALLARKDPGQWVPPGVESVRVFTPPHHPLEPWILPLELALVHLDLLHSTDFIPPRGPLPSVITVHDLAFLRWPHLLAPGAARYYGQIHRAVRQAKAIIAVSKATRDDLISLTGADPDRIEVIYEAADPVFRPLTLAELNRLETQLRSHGYLQRVPRTDAPVVLAVATLEPRKNLLTLLHAFSRISSNGTGPQLWIAGGRGWLDEEIYNAFTNLPTPSPVILLGEVTRDELLWLYNRATLVAQPSLYEGFGLPVVEAMACGKPVLASSVPALNEIVADGGILLPPTKVEAWADAIEWLLHDEAARTSLSQRAIVRAGTFSWEAAARQTVEVYRKALGY